MNYSMKFHGKNLIAGSWEDGMPEAGFQSRNPNTGEVLEPIYNDASLEQVKVAIDEANQAFADFRTTTPEHRADFLETLAIEVEERGEEIIACAQAETALGQQRLKMELSRTLAQPKLFAELIREGSWLEARIDSAELSRQPIPRPSLRSMLQPVGPVAVFGASNFPLAISVVGTDTVCAFAAGCPVVIKAHPAHPRTCEITAQAVVAALKKHNLPPSLFSLLHGLDHGVGQSIIAHPKLAAVAFTGSLAGGRALMDAAARREVPIPVFAEMGSLNPVFLLPDALKNHGSKIAEGFVQALTLGVGQFCTNPSVLLALDCPALDTFLRETSQHVQACEPETMLHKGIHLNYTELSEAFSNLSGLSVVAKTKSADAKKLEADVTLLETNFSTWSSTQKLQQECFGPTSIIIRAKNLEELLEFARNMEGSLTATLHGTNEDLDTHKELIKLLETRVGRLVFNGFPPGVEIGHATHHGGPYPATSTGAHTSIGLGSIQRFVRPICYQGCPDSQLPRELQDANPRGILRTVDGKRNRNPIS